jgi:CBS domain-containing membrane protein
MRQHLFKRILGDWPEASSVSWLERLRSACGAAIGLLVIILADRLFINHGGDSHWIVASIGASAFLIFVLPSSPMAQPWAVIGGSCIAALVAIICNHLIHPIVLLIPVSVGAAILAMFTLRCLHPPAAALALLTSLNEVTDFNFVFSPVFGNTLLLVVCAVVYNTLTKKPYPHHPKEIADITSIQRRDRLIEEDEINTVLSRYNEVLDISRADLANLVAEVEHSAYQKKLQSMCCRDIMTSDVAFVSLDSSLEIAWRLLRSRRIKALPVIDGAKRVLGIITLEDFLKSAAVDFDQTFGQRIRGFLRNTIPSLNIMPNAVGQVMSKPVRVISEDRNMLDLAEIFCGDGHHHIPVINAKKELVGMITQSDFVKAIDRSIDIR